MDGYGKIFLLLAAIGLILLATSGKGRQIFQVLTGKASVSQSVPQKNPTDLRDPSNRLGETDLRTNPIG